MKLVKFVANLKQILIPSIYNIYMQNHATRLCKVCNENLPRKNFARHMEKHNEVIYSCDICNLNFTRKDALKRHKGTHNKPENDSPPNYYFRP